MNIVYRTENKINKRYYYGVHCRDDDSYLGSGSALKAAIKKYGRDNFVRRTIMEFTTEQEAYDFEELLVDKLLLEDPLCYNLNKGGRDYENINQSSLSREVTTLTDKSFSSLNEARAATGISKKAIRKNVNKLGYLPAVDKESYDKGDYNHDSPKVIIY